MGPNTLAAIPDAPYAPSILGSGDATAEGIRGVTFKSTTLTSAVLPPHIELPMIINNHGGGWWRPTSST